MLLTSSAPQSFSLCHSTTPPTPSSALTDSPLDPLYALWHADSLHHATLRIQAVARFQIPALLSVTLSELFFNYSHLVSPSPSSSAFRSALTSCDPYTTARHRLPRFLKLPELSSLLLASAVPYRLPLAQFLRVVVFHVINFLSCPFFLHPLSHTVFFIAPLLSGLSAEIVGASMSSVSFVA